jgi:hypothetical protein
MLTKTKYTTVMNVNSICMMNFLSILNYKITSPTFKGEHVIQIKGFFINLIANNTMEI